MDFSVFDAARAANPNLHWGDALAFLAAHGAEQFAVAQKIVAAIPGGLVTLLPVLVTVGPGEVQFGTQFIQLLLNGAPAQ